MEPTDYLRAAAALAFTLSLIGLIMPLFRNAPIRPVMQPQRGFNLIEAAIVLGVIGLVIGGIWVAASSVSYKMRINSYAQVILSAVTKTQELFKNVATTGTNTSATLQAVGTIPPDWRLSGNTLVSPDNEFAFRATITSTSVSIQLDNGSVDIAYEDCINLLPLITRTGDLTRIGGSLQSYTEANGRLPISMTNIQAECEYVNNYMELFYRR